MLGTNRSDSDGGLIGQKMEVHGTPQWLYIGTGMGGSSTSNPTYRTDAVGRHPLQPLQPPPKAKPHPRRDPKEIPDPQTPPEPDISEPDEPHADITAEDVYQDMEFAAETPPPQTSPSPEVFSPVEISLPAMWTHASWNDPPLSAESEPDLAPNTLDFNSEWDTSL